MQADGFHAQKYVQSPRQRGGFFHLSVIAAPRIARTARERSARRRGRQIFYGLAAAPFRLAARHEFVAHDKFGEAETALFLFAATIAAAPYLSAATAPADFLFPFGRFAGAGASVAAPAAAVTGARGFLLLFALELAGD